MTATDRPIAPFWRLGRIHPLLIQPATGSGTRLPGSMAGAGGAQAADLGAAKPSIRSDIPLKIELIPKKSPSTQAESDGHRE
jgi:hypothetical protein